MLDNIKDGIT